MHTVHHVQALIVGDSETALATAALLADLRARVGIMLPDRSIGDGPPGETLSCRVPALYAEPWAAPAITSAWQALSLAHDLRADLQLTSVQYLSPTRRLDWGGAFGTRDFAREFDDKVRAGVTALFEDIESRQGAFVRWLADAAPYYPPQTWTRLTRSWFGAPDAQPPEAALVAGRFANTALDALGEAGRAVEAVLPFLYHGVAWRHPLLAARALHLCSSGVARFAGLRDIRRRLVERVRNRGGHVVSTSAPITVHKGKGSARFAVHAGGRTMSADTVIYGLPPQSLGRAVADLSRAAEDVVDRLRRLPVRATAHTVTVTIRAKVWPRGLGTVAVLDVPDPAAPGALPDHPARSPLLLHAVAMEGTSIEEKRRIEITGHVPTGYWTAGAGDPAAEIVGSWKRRLGMVVPWLEEHIIEVESDPVWPADARSADLPITGGALLLEADRAFAAAPGQFNPATPAAGLWLASDLSGFPWGQEGVYAVALELAETIAAFLKLPARPTLG